MVIASLNCENISVFVFLCSLTLLSPEIIHAIIAGTLEKDIGIEQLKQAMPLMWNEQKKMFGIE